MPDESRSISWQMPHDEGQAFSIAYGLVSQWPDLAHVLQCTSRSMHTDLQRPHECEQLASMNAGLLVQWPSPDHCRHAVAFSCTSEQLAGSQTVDDGSPFVDPSRVVIQTDPPSWINEPPWWWLTPPWWIATPPP